jgi:DNA-binding GntR family transcriptional regulator
MKNKIMDGHYTKGFKLPSISDLCEIYGVSNATIRESLRLLKNDDLIYTLPRKGTFVKGKRNQQYKFDFQEERILKYELQSYKILSSSVVSESVNDISGVYKKNLILYYHKNLPVLFEISYLRISKTYQLRDNRQGDWFKDYKRVLDNYDVNKTLSIQLKPADEDVSKHLFLSLGQSVFEINVGYYTRKEQIIGLSRKFVSEEDIVIEFY